MAFGFLKKAVKSAGKIAGGAIKGVNKGVNAVGKGIGKVPVVGGGLKGVYNLTLAAPINLTADIAKGTRLDKVALNHVRRQVKDVKEVAPYAQMVIQVVPGVGQGVSGALSAGLALASGQPIDKAIMEGVKGALPGGPVAKSAFDVATAAVQGKRIDEIAINALPLNDQQKKLVKGALKASVDVASGKRVDKALLDASLKTLPPDVKKALDAGIAIAHGANIQKTVVKGVTSAGLERLAKVGNGIAAKNPVLKAGSQLLKDKSVKAGFDVGLGLMNHKVKPFDLVAIRKKLKPEQQKGFDIALSAHIGLTDKKTPQSKNPKEAFGAATTKGMISAPKATKSKIVLTVAKDPQAKAGVAIVVQAEAAKNKVWWRKLLEKLHLMKAA